MEEPKETPPKDEAPIKKKITELSLAELQAQIGLMEGSLIQARIQAEANIGFDNGQIAVLKVIAKEMAERSPKE